MNNIEYLRAQEERQITLNEWCEAYYNCNIVEFPQDQTELLHQIAVMTIELQNNSERINRRVNEQGNDTEEFLVQAIRNTLNCEPKRLGTAYPDIKCGSPKFEFPLIADSKIRKNLKVSDSLRIFYTSTPKEKTVLRKSITTSYHLLFLFEHDGNNTLNGDYRVVDMCGFKYTSKGRIQEGSYNDILKHGKFIAERITVNL